MAEQNFLVSGMWENKQVREEVEAYSDKQAKTKAGFNIGLAGKDIGEFSKSKKIRVSRR